MRRNSKGHGMSKTNRILSLFERLARGEVLKKSHEVQRFGVNEKTFRRDIEDLRNYLAEMYPEEDGTEIVYDWAANGYILRRDRSVWLTSGEILALSKIMLGSRVFSVAETNALLDKLILQSLPKDRRHIQDALGNERFYYSPATDNHHLCKTIWAFSYAIREQLRMDVVYRQSEDGPVIEQTLEVQGLLFSMHHFYVVAYIKGGNQELWVFKLDKIENYRISHNHFRVEYKNRIEEGWLRNRMQVMESSDSTIFVL